MQRQEKEEQLVRGAQGFHKKKSVAVKGGDHQEDRNLEMVEFYRRHPNLDSIKTSNVNPLKFSKEMQETILKKKNGFYSEKVSVNDQVSVQSSQTDKPRLESNLQFDQPDHTQNGKSLARELFKKKKHSKLDPIDQPEKTEEFKATRAVLRRAPSDRDPSFYEYDNSIADSHLNYTESYIHLTDSNASKLERRQQEYNVFNTYSSVKNPKNLMVRKDRARAIRDLMGENSYNASGLDITVFRDVSKSGEE